MATAIGLVHHEAEARPRDHRRSEHESGQRPARPYDRDEPDREADELAWGLIDTTGCYALRTDDGERLTFGSGSVVIKASTPGLTVWEERPPLLDTPLHVHAHEDELFHILEGEHVFECGDDRFEVGPGDFLLLPRGVPHAHRRVVPGVGRFLVMTCPGGFDGFFRMLSDADRAGTLGPETYTEASLRYGLTWLS